MTATGKTSDGGKSWTYMSSMADPMTGKDTPEETRIAVADHDHYTLEMWSPGPEGVWCLRSATSPALVSSAYPPS